MIAPRRHSEGRRSGDAGGGARGRGAGRAAEPEVIKKGKKDEEGPRRDAQGGEEGQEVALDR